MVQRGGWEEVGKWKERGVGGWGKSEELERGEM